ncbi:MAG TPA: hypothetical protein VF609_11835 [Flavisolibacter sp.]
MSRLNIIIYCCLLVLFAAGIFLRNYLGGFLSGFSIAILLLSTLGQRQANRAADRIDKKIRDHVSNKNSNDGN